MFLQVRPEPSSRVVHVLFFSSVYGKPFTDWDSQKDPIRRVRTLEMLSEVLNIYSDLPQTESFTDEINEEMKEFEEWEEWKG